jgi:hypothetical protein
MGVTHDGFVLVLKLILDDSRTLAFPMDVLSKLIFANTYNKDSVLSAKKRCVQQLIAWRTYPAEFAFVDLCMLGELELVQLLAGSAKEMPRCPIDFNYREVDRGGGHTGFTVRSLVFVVASKMLNTSRKSSNIDCLLPWISEFGAVLEPVGRCELSGH